MKKKEHPIVWVLAIIMGLASSIGGVVFLGLTARAFWEIFMVGYHVFGWG